MRIYFHFSQRRCYLLQLEVINHLLELNHTPPKCSLYALPFRNNAGLVHHGEYIRSSAEFVLQLDGTAASVKLVFVIATHPASLPPTHPSTPILSSIYNNAQNKHVEKQLA